MDFVNREVKPDETHKLTEWKSTILAPSGTARFYSIRNCKTCGYEEADGNAHLMDLELLKPCEM
jgi:hypothetical protein